MVVGQMPVATDVVIIGSGPGGAAAALELGAAGLDVTMVERDAFGGVCLNTGCIPSKTLLEIASAAHGDRTATWGVDSSVTLDRRAMRLHMTEVIGGLTAGLRRRCEEVGVTTIAGEAKVLGPGHVVVATSSDAVHLHCKTIVVATGSRPRELRAIPFDGERVLDSTAALELGGLPGTLAIVGGGYIGVELATAFAKLGVEVTLVEAASRVLPTMDPALGNIARRGLERLGVDVRLGTVPVRLTKKNLVVEHDGELQSVRAKQVIVAVGRMPNTADLGLETLPLQVDDAGLVAVDEQRRACANVFAIGDIVAGPALAHKASAEGRVVAAAILGDTAAAFEPTAIPLVVFGDPELLAVGVQPSDAPSESRVVKIPLAASGRARAAGETVGFTTLVADAAGTIIGAQAAGPHASELSAALTLAIELAATVDDLAETVHAHPTIAESIAECALELRRRN